MRRSCIKSLSELARAVRNNPFVQDNFAPAILVIAYIFAVYGIHMLFGIHGKVILRFYYDWFTRLAIVFSALFILLHIRNKSYQRYLSPRYMAGFLAVYFLAPPFAGAFASFKQTIYLIHPFSWDVSLTRLDFVLHCGHHPWRLLAPILDHPFLLRAIDFLYVCWFVFLAMSCLWMAWTKRRQLRLCFLISTLLVWSLLGSGLGSIFSSAGPCYYSQVAPAAENPFAALMLRLSAIDQSTSLWAISNQIGLWEAKLHGTWLPFGGISAMPSIHLAMATLFALLAFSVRRWLGIVFIGYVLVIQIGSVILGWHYAVDGYAGILLALLIWYAVKRFTMSSNSKPEIIDAT